MWSALRESLRRDRRGCLHQREALPALAQKTSRSRITGEGHSVISRIARYSWAVWLVALIGYTYLLIAPNDWLPPWLQTTVGHKITEEFTFGKLAHVGTYALLTLGTFFLPVSRQGWIACVAIMSLHAFGTEFVQSFTGRHGCWSDVGIDHIGIAIGLLLGGLSRYLGIGGRR